VYSIVQRKKEKDLRYIQEVSDPTAVTVYQTCKIVYICNISCYFGWFGDFLIELIGSLYLEGQRPVYVQSPICVRVCSIDLRRITLVLMHILIQPPSSYKSSLSYKTSDSAETHDPSTHATLPPLAAFRSKSISP